MEYFHIDDIEVSIPIYDIKREMNINSYYRNSDETILVTIDTKLDIQTIDKLKTFDKFDVLYNSVLLCGGLIKEINYLNYNDNFTEITFIFDFIKSLQKEELRRIKLNKLLN